MHRMLCQAHMATDTGKMLTRAQMGIMTILVQEGPMSLKELAAKLTMSSSAATQLVDGLSAETLLIRTEDSRDRRKVRVSLTAKGKRRLEQAHKKRTALFTSVLADLSDAELKTLVELQRKISHSPARR